MQEVLPFVRVAAPAKPAEWSTIGRKLKWILVTVWVPIGWALEMFLAQPPQQELIEEQRLKAIRLRGHF